ncbi:MAG: M23 family metallopeptidase [Tildeniella nuda ZEHNDER 1965/U140]|nr:M23 family metallopeptidase [Tildeniella nuda ZEHNDER 1965/U140]
MALAQGATDAVQIASPAVSPVEVSPSVTAPVALPSTEAAIPHLVVTPTAPEKIVQPSIVQPSPTNSRPDDGYDAPTSIVLTERSTGCRAVLQSGQVLEGSPCALDERRQTPKASIASGGLPAVSVSALASVTGLGTSASPTWQAYYKRTARPSGRLGNGNIRLIFPLSIPAPISSLFGWRVHPVTGAQRFHSGTDLAAPLGTPVLAAYAGKVAIADFLGGYGLAVALDHNKGTQGTVYAHLSEIFVKPGEWVKQGMVIGRVGSTGLSTGPHLHFEFRQLTPEGWVAMDAGAQLEYALAQLVTAMQVAQAKAAPKG